MTFVRARARILEISTTSGGGPLALAGAADGSYNTFASFMAVGDQTYVTVVEPGVAFWSGVATYSAANQITLTTVEEVKGTFGAGTKEVMAGSLASTSMLREDTAGGIVTGGTSTAYTMSSFRQFPSKAVMNGAEVAFTVHATNGANPTLNVDGLGGDTLIIDAASGPTPVPPGTLIAGGVYSAVYYNSGNNWRLKDFYQLPFVVPIGGMIDYFGTSAPSSNFVFPYGQAISRLTYAALFAITGTTYGIGDGSTTFNIPDLRGRIVAGKDDMGGSAASRLSGASITTGGATTLGGSGGAETKTLVTANLPAYTPSGSVSQASGTVPVQGGGNTGGSIVTTGAGYGTNTGGAATLPLTLSSQTFTGTPQGGTSTAFPLLPPTLIANKLLRII
jgi:microcystin-dependent protein